MASHNGRMLNGSAAMSSWHGVAVPWAADSDGTNMSPGASDT